MRRGSVRSGPWSAFAALLTASCAAATSGTGDTDGVRLVELEQRPKAGETYRALGLTGRNKPNGLEYRLRAWVPPETPQYVNRRLGALELRIADRTPDGWLALYRGPLPAGPGNAEHRAILYAPDGSRRYDLDLGRFLSASRHLEVQDIRWVDGDLVFNEACQSYATDAGGRCSALLRVDPQSETVVWRTRDLVSNNIIVPHDGWILAGYGFTNEPDHLHLVSAATGAVVDRLPLDSAMYYIERVGDELVVVTYANVYRVRIEG